MAVYSLGKGSTRLLGRVAQRIFVLNSIYFPTETRESQRKRLSSLRVKGKKHIASKLIFDLEFDSTRNPSPFGFRCDY